VSAPGAGKAARHAQGVPGPGRRGGQNLPHAARSPRVAPARRGCAAGLHRNPRPRRHRGAAGQRAAAGPQAGVLQGPRGGRNGPGCH
nr:hypothetical protein [Tanacetum cinerariifolium]